MENAMIWLINQYGEDKILDKKTLVPTPEYFPIDFDGSEDAANKVVSIVSLQMDIHSEDIILNFYDQQLLEFKGDLGNSLFTQQYDDEKYTSGLYQGKDKDGKYSIALERGLLKQPEKIVATIAHELAHIKLLGEERLKENDEYLTDLVTVFFGLGIFNANSAAQFYSDANKWGYNKQGYLIQQEWGYALALYAFIRREKDPFWMQYLSTNIKSDFLKSQNYISNNTDKVLV
jgi:hypothetical protein